MIKKKNDLNNIFKISYIALAALILFALPFSFVKATDLGDGGYDYVDTSYPMTGGGYDYIDTSYPIDYGYTGGYYGGYGYTSYGIGGYSIPSYSYPIYSNGLSSSYINTSNIISNTNISSSYINTTNITNNSSVSTQPYYYYPQPTYYQQPQYISYQQPLAYNSAPYVSLSAVPYTGLDLGPVGTVFYWGFLILWCLAAAYLIVVKRVQNKILSWLTKSFHLKSITVLFIIGIVLLIGYPVKKTIHIIEEYIELSGLGYSSDSWKKSETIEYLTKHKVLGKSYTIYSNEPEAVYILTNLNTKRSPAKTFYNSPQHFDIYPNQKDSWLNAENVCLIWFDKTNRSSLFTINELQKNINMTEVAHLKDGMIYTFSSK